MHPSNFYPEAFLRLASVIILLCYQPHYSTNTKLNPLANVFHDNDHPEPSLRTVLTEQNFSRIKKLLNSI